MIRPAFSHKSFIIFLIAIIYFFSGFIALVYEVLWARMLSLLFGVSIFGVVITTSAFMMGLGLGSAGGYIWAKRHSRFLGIFGALELGIAIYALSLPFLLQTLDAVSGKLLSETNLITFYGLQALIALVLLVMPAMAMGVGFSFVLRAAHLWGMPTGILYGLNTAGGALGALAPLALLPILGWTNSLRFAAVIGLIIGIVSLLVDFLSNKKAVSLNTLRTLHISHKTLLLYAAIGALALALQIGWVRLYGMIFLRTEYVLAIVLSIFLIGMGLGSLLVSYRVPSWLLKALPAVAGFASIVGQYATPFLAQWLADATFDSLFEASLWQGAAIALLTLPVTLALGAWYPLLSREYGDDAAAAARLYAVNSLGAGCGAIAAGFVLIPVLGTAGTIMFSAIGLLIVGAWLAPFKFITWALISALILAVPVSRLPPTKKLLGSAHANTTDLYKHEDAISITHVVEEANGQRLLLADLQRMDASSDPTAVIAQQNQARLPLLLHPNPGSVLFLGLGTGISASGSLPFPGLKRTGVELSTGATVAAEKFFGSVNQQVTGQMRVVQDDARRFLRAPGGSYDVIIGDLFHPDLAGRGALLSIEQFQRARERLAINGIFVQWLALNQFDTASLAVVMRSFKQVFPQAVIFIDGFRLALVGPKDSWTGAPAMLKNLSRLGDEQRFAATGGEEVWTWLGRYWGPLNLPQGVVQNEWFPKIEFYLPRAKYRGDLDLAQVLTWLLQQRPKLEDARAALNITPVQAAEFERAYAATELATRAWLAMLQGNTPENHRLLRLAYQANSQDNWIGFSLADAMFASLQGAVAAGVEEKKALEAILRIRPDHVEALRAIWHLEERSGNVQAARQYRAQLATISPLDKEVQKSQGNDK